MEHQQALEQFFYRLSEYCDAQDWDNYIDQYAPEAEFHVPQWKSEHEYTTNPKKEMSLIYYANRNGLEDRVFRILTGKSAACTPMPRTLHLINNLRYTQEGGEFKVKVNWVTHYNRFGESNVFFGVAHYKLKQEGQGFKITYKQTLVLNDKIDSVFDFYHI